MILFGFGVTPYKVPMSGKAPAVSCLLRFFRRVTLSLQK